MLPLLVIASLIQANPDLAAGRTLYDEMQFRSAEARLRLAKEQASDDQELNEVLYLLARTLAAQRRMREAEDVYAELLARVPAAPLPEGVSPTLTDAFIHAKERLYPKGFVRLLPRKTAAGTSVFALVDPWSAVKSIAVEDELETGERTTRELALSPAGELSLESVVPGVRMRRLLVSDASGTHLADVQLKKSEPVEEVARIEREPAVAPTTSRWPEWATLALGAVAAGVGAGLAVSSSADYHASQDAYWASESLTLGHRAQGKAVAANVCIGGALAAGAAAAVMWTIRF